jgi:hypothetical protein
VPLETFDLIPNLPTELRNPIWEFHCLHLDSYQSTFVNVFLRQVRADRGEDFERRAYYNRFYPTSPAFTKLHEILRPRSLVALLFACKQSRQMAFRQFDFCFSTSLNEGTIVRRQGHDKVKTDGIC